MKFGPDIRGIVAGELRLAGLTTARPEIPLPNDLDTEALLLSSVLDGYCTPTSLLPLEPTDFFSNFNSALFMVLQGMEQLGEDLSFDTVKQRLFDIGLRGDVEAELKTVWYTQPFVLQKHIPSLASKIIVLRMAREAIALLQSADVRLRTSEDPTETLILLKASISGLLESGEQSQSSECLPESAEHSEFRATPRPPRPTRKSAERPNGKAQAPRVVERPSKWPTGAQTPAASEQKHSTNLPHRAIALRGNNGKKS